MSKIDYTKLDIETQSLSKSMSFTNIKKRQKIIQKVKNCIIINLNFKKTTRLVIGPHFYVYPFALSFFIFFDYFVLTKLWTKLSSFMIKINIMVLFYLIIIYTINLFIDPGIIFYNKADFDNDSEICCNICLTTKSDKAVHCKECGVCVVERSHHCFWISKCVGKYNEAVFYGFVVGGVLYYVVIFMITAIVHFIFF